MNAYLDAPVVPSTIHCNFGAENALTDVETNAKVYSFLTDTAAKVTRLTPAQYRFSILNVIAWPRILEIRLR